MPPMPRLVGGLCGALLIVTIAPSLLVHGQSAGAPILLTPNVAGTGTANRGSGAGYLGRPRAEHHGEAHGVRVVGV